MKHWKLVVIGGLVFYVVTFLLSFVTGPLIHNGVLKETYRAHAPLWRPELNQDPPDMAALMPRWIVTGIIASLIIAGVYAAVRPAFAGPGWLRGVKGAVCLALLLVAWGPLGYAGVFNMPDKIWIWWVGEGAVLYLVAGAVLGWLGEKLDPLP
jgi:hypothetical protein